MTAVKRERDGNIGVLTLNDPASLNAMTPELLGDLATAVSEMTNDATIRALVLTGEGRGFCSGQNLKAFHSLGNDIVTLGVWLLKDAAIESRACDAHPSVTTPPKRSGMRRCAVTANPKPKRPTPPLSRQDRRAH